MKLAVRTFAVWLVLIGLEIVHGAARALLLTPYVGDFASRQIGVFTGSLIIAGVAYAFYEWLGAFTRSAQTGVGIAWLALTLGFEFGMGHAVFDRSWDDLLADYQIWRGGFLALGMAVLALSPRIAARLHHRYSVSSSKRPSA